MKMERVGEKRGGSRSIDISGIPQSVLDRSTSGLPSSGPPSSPNGHGHGHGHSRLNLYLSPTSEKSGRVKSPGMTNGRNSSHPSYFVSSALPLTKNVGVGVNLTQGMATTTGLRTTTTPQVTAGNGRMGFSSQPPPPGRGPSHSPTPTSSPGLTSPILPELLQQVRGGGKTTLVPSPSPMMNSAKGSLTTTNQRDLFNNLNQNGNKIVSQNLNGTLAVTSVPTNDSELQLFRVLQRANLLNYFDVMIELGGDDVQQLCDAGEEEFLEIMALVGMASKPLHVRRLQKSLQDWVTQPSLFPGPVLGPPLSAFAGSLTNQLRDQESSSNCGNPSNTSPQLPIRPIPFHSGNPTSVANPSASFLSPNELKTLHMKFLAMKNSMEKNQTLTGSNNNNGDNRSSPSPINHSPTIPTTVVSIASVPPGHHSHSPVIPIPFHSQSPNSGLSNGGQQRNTSSPSLYSNPPSSQSSYPYSNGVGIGAQLRIPADQIIPSQFLETRIRTRSEPNSPAGSGSSSESPQLDSRSSLSPIPFLQDHEVQKIADAAIKIIQSLPQEMNEPRVSAKRKTSADYETVLRIADEDPGKLDKVRKYAAIYGRYDCKRKVQKPLTIHELSVNEAASHLCNHVPALLTRRDELFLLSRQVVRDAGLPYSSIISTTSGNMLISQIKNSRHRNHRLDEGSSNGSTDSCGNNNFGTKKIRLEESVDADEFNRPRSAPGVDTATDDHSLLPNHSAKSISDGQPSPFDEQTPEIGRNARIYGNEPTVYSPQYEYNVPDDLSVKKHPRKSKDRVFRSYHVKSEPSSS